MVMRRTKPEPSLDPALSAASKVPLILGVFWVVKVLTTGMGEVTSDFLVRAIDPVIAVGIGAVALVAALAIQFRATRYVAWIYWLACVMVSVFGTMAADVVHVELHVPYVVSTVFFAVALAAIFAAWYVSERTLSIHSIRSRRREAFYWATVLTTFALGTAAGDLTAFTLSLGFLASAVLFAAVIAVPAAAYRLGANAVLTFWLAYIATRPLGASFADWMGMPQSRSGLGWGLAQVSLALTLVIAGLVAYLTVTRMDVEEAAARSMAD
jgi:uncharacterized membrane-anchored protein